VQGLVSFVRSGTFDRGIRIVLESLEKFETSIVPFTWNDTLYINSVHLMIGLQENYWEVPQAIFVGAMLIKVSYSYLCYRVARKS